MSSDPADGGDARLDLPVLTRLAERLEELADTAELMGDDDGAGRFRTAARNRRLEAMELLDRTG